MYMIIILGVLLGVHVHDYNIRCNLLGVILGVHVHIYMYICTSFNIPLYTSHTGVWRPLALSSGTSSITIAMVIMY